MVLKYNDMIFDRFVTIDENHVPTIVEVPEQNTEPDAEPVKPDGDRVQFSVEDEPVTIEKDMEIVFKVDAETLTLKDSFTHLKDEKDYAMAMVLVFEEVVNEYINEKMKENIVHYNGFEKEFTKRI